jgi:hypothetical protein
MKLQHASDVYFVAISGDLCAGTEEKFEHFSQDGWSRRRNSHLGSPKYETGALITSQGGRSN